VKKNCAVVFYTRWSQLKRCARYLLQSHGLNGEIVMGFIEKNDGLSLLLEGSLSQNIANLAAVLKERVAFMQDSQIAYLPKTTHQPAEKVSQLDTKQELKILQNDTIGDCQRCKLCSGRTQVVFGVGNSDADLVFVGEAPGADEDRLGEPFVGRAGKLLTRMIEAMGFSREQIYICNVVKCRPPENRNPELDEIQACEPFLKAQLGIVKPKVIVALGRFACQCLLRTEETMSDIRGKWQKYEGIAIMPTFHPAYLLRSPSKKKEVWEDLQKVMEFLKKAD
jgi:uracil-DNA glycosylase